MLPIKLFHSFRAEDSKSSSGTDRRSEDRGWFRRRDKSSSRELDRGYEEKSSDRSRWFRRRDKQRNSVDYGIKRRNSDKKIDSAGRKEVIEVGLQDQRKRSSSDQTAAQERLKIPSGVTVRRLSSPEIDAPEVITASLSFDK